MRLIDADALVERTQELEDFFVTSWTTEKVQRLIRKAPTVDAVKVVFCKDCKQSMLWRKPENKIIGECLIRKMNSEDEQFCLIGAGDFCSCGKRRE